MFLFFGTDYADFTACWIVTDLNRVIREIRAYYL